MRTSAIFVLLALFAVAVAITPEEEEAQLEAEFDAAMQEDMPTMDVDEDYSVQNAVHEQGLEF